MPKLFIGGAPVEQDESSEWAIVLRQRLHRDELFRSVVRLIDDRETPRLSALKLASALIACAEFAKEYRDSDVDLVLIERYIVAGMSRG